MRALVLLMLSLGACRTNATPEDGGARASPQADVMPAPLSSAPAATVSALPAVDAGPPPSALHFDEPLPPDVGLVKDVQGLTLEASVRPLDMPVVPKSPEIASAQVESLRRKTELKLVIDLGAGRARVVFGAGSVLMAGTELRARAERYGQILVSPDGSYRVLEPGVLRAVVGERRLDASTLSGAEVTPKGEGQRLRMKTRKVDLVTRAGKGSFELVRLAEAGESGVVLARVLGSLLDAPPATTLASEGDVPVRAEITWATPTHGGLVFEVTNVTKHELGARELAVPPPSATFTTGALPQISSEMLVAPADVVTIHGATTDRATLALTNGTDDVRFAWLEGVPVAWLGPRGRVELPSMPKGKYQIVWRSFLGDVVEAPRVIEAPGTYDASGADGGL